MSAHEFHHLSLTEQVRRAQPLARTAVLTGIRPDRGGHGQADIESDLTKLVGHDGPACDDGEFSKLMDLVAAAYALGIATGLHMRPEAFTGAKR